MSIIWPVALPSIKVFFNNKENFDNWKLTGYQEQWLVSGAESLALICEIEQIRLNKKVNILIPSYFCGQSLKHLRDSGNDIIFYNVNKDLSPDYKKLDDIVKIKKVDVMLHVHYFGKIMTQENSRDFCDKNNTLQNKDITIVTNLTNTNPKMTQWLPKMKSWIIWASLDGIGEVTEYIRYPSNFKKVTENLNFYKSLIDKHSNGKITFSPAVQLLNIHQLDDMLKWFIKFSDGDWGNTINISWMSQVWYPKICNYDTAPRDYRLWVADKLEKSADYFSGYAGISYFYNKQIENLRKDTLDKVTEQHLQNSFMRYNDTQDKHRKRNTWRELLPLLEEALTNNLK